MTTFDLIQEPWIPVTIAGSPGEVSLREALTRAHDIDALALDEPLETVAVLRQVLLPVVLDAFGAPTDEEQWAERWRSPALDAARLGDYLDEHADRFDLFHSERPFAQVAGLRTAKDETKPVSLLLSAMATGNNVPLFSVRTEADPPALTPARAARALLASHCWDTAAIKSGAVGDPQVKAGKTTGNPPGPLGQLGVTIPFGRTLAETLALNLPILRQGVPERDRPQWRASNAATARWAERHPRGLLDLLTWQARRIRLIPETATSGPSDAALVRRVVLAAGDRLLQTPVDVEPHTAWKRVDKPKAGEPSNRPIRHQPGREAWRGLASMLATRADTAAAITASGQLRLLGRLRAQELLPADLPLQVLTVGVAYGNQSAVVEDVMVDLIPLPIAALAQDSPTRLVLQQVVEESSELWKAANRLPDDLRRALGAESLPWDRSLRLGEVLLHACTPPVRRLLAGLQHHPDSADLGHQAWRQTARRLALEVAEPVLATTPPEAFMGRAEKDTRTQKVVVYCVATAERHYRASITRILGRPELSPDQADGGRA